MINSLSRSSHYLRYQFSFDLRALALMRIGLACLLLLDLSIRAVDLEAHYTNAGIVPLTMLFEYKWNSYHFSLHTISGMWYVQVLLFLTAALFAFFMLLGYKTRLATFLSWVMLISIQNRNPLILQGGDDLLRMLLFWGLFLPWNRRYALDMTDREAAMPNQYFSMACFAYMIQVASVYFFSALLKNSPEWHTEGTALYYALSLDQILLPGGRLIYPYPELLKWLTLSVYYIELFVPFLLFIPFKNNFFRILVIAVLTGFHLGISVTLYVGLFFMIGIVSLWGMLPESAMNLMEKLLGRWMNYIATQVEKMRSWLAARVVLDLNLHFKKQLLSHPQRFTLREGVVTMALAYSCLWNWGSVNYLPKGIAEGARWPGYVLRLDQHWGMFAPRVFKDDGWYILEATTANNELIDLNHEGGKINYAKPFSVVSMFGSDRWRKYSENYLFVFNSYMRPYYCNYMMRKWNQSHPDKPITQLDVIYMKEVTQPDYQKVTPSREVLCKCKK